ncbi:hypothetical protein ATCC90586_003201 [Pythium insidiosum]|nr:hypothetical protein ATCC90586_003201 [Pythium insidiosum]
MRVRAVEVISVATTSHRRARSKPWRPTSFSATLVLCRDLLAVLLIFTLDLFDIYFKTQWIGPQDTFSFTAIGTQVLQQQPLVPVSNVTTPGASDERLSGWSSFLEKCDSLRPIGGNFFLHAMGENCRFGPASANVSVPKIMFASSLRVDSVAWAACKLLRADRRPVVCRSRMVENFPTHYNMAETPLLLSYPSRDATATTEVPVSHDVESWTSEPGSAAETEVLELLDVIGESAPLGRVICVEGFVYQGPGRYVSSIFGCGSPNRYHSAFVGVHASAMAQFHQNKAWLTSDWLYLFGVPLLIRQNCLSLFNVVVDADQTVALVHQTLMNYCSSGGLYVIVIAIDAFLLAMNVLSSIEVAGSIPWHDTTRNAPPTAAPGQLVASDYQDVLTRRMLRSPTFSLLMLLSQLLSWTVVLANSLIWTWTEALWGRLRAFLSTLRFWMIVLISMNAVWNAAVSLSERRAYAVVRCTFVAMYEVLVVSTVVAFFSRDRLFDMSGDKYAIEGQRQVDTSAFHGARAFANAFPEWLGTVQVTAPRVFWTIYRPLLRLVGSSLAGILLIALVRFTWHVWRRESRHKGTRVQPLARVMVGPSRSFFHDSVRLARDMSVRTMQAITPAPYERLAIEHIVQQPLRARSFVRSREAMEVSTGSRSVLRVATLVDHGVLLDPESGVLRERRGFLGVLSDVVAVPADMHCEPSRRREGGDHQRLWPLS